MSMVMAVSFTRYGRLYYLDPAGHSPKVGDKVLVPTDDGTEVAECVWAPQFVTDDIGGLPEMAGMAGEPDLERDERNRRRRAEVKVAVKRLIREHDLPMKPVGIDVQDRGSPPKIVVYFTAPHRVDFRDLLRDIARTLDFKVELRHLGARDEARVQGGIGPCGRDLCCATFLKDFEPVSVRMAKDQDLPVNPLKISGACGRLMCCLKYEHPLYQEFKADAPSVGKTVGTPDGDGRVIAHDVPREAVVVRLSASGQTCRCSRADVCAPRQAYDSANPVSSHPVASNPVSSNPVSSSTSPQGASSSDA